MNKIKLWWRAHPKARPLTYTARRRSPASGILLSIGALAVLTLFTIVPFVFVFIDSINKNADTISQPFSLSSKNFDNLFNDARYANAIYNSGMYALFTVPISIVVSALIAWSIATLHRKYAKGFWQSIFFVPYITSVVAISLTFVYIFDGDYGLLNTVIKGVGGSKVNWLTDPSGDPELTAFIIFGVWRNIAFEVLILSTAMMSIDRRLYQVSALDGASNLKQFFKITIPNVLPVLIYLITLSLIQSIKVFPLALFGNSSLQAFRSNGQTLLLYTFHMIRLANYGLAAASSMILAVISISAVLILRTGPKLTRRFVKFQKTWTRRELWN